MRRVLFALSLLGALALCVSPADAAWQNGASIVSASIERLEQADGPSQFVDISDDGRYAAFQTRAQNLFAQDDPDPPRLDRVGGIFRYELATGKLELVADGDLFDSGLNLVRKGAQAPSISADGRYVAFSTGYRLVSADKNDKLDVYVRDMDVPIRQPGAFELISARDGGDVPAKYANASEPLTGADVTHGVAISADGSKVVFRTTDDSDLPDRPSADTPAFQLFVRDRTQKTTTLVTRRTNDGTPAGGADRAQISADGTTVVWTGRNASSQTRFLAGEFPDDNSLWYLWRRVADGPGAPTRRITGEADPDDPDCPSPGSIVKDQTATGPCYGPLGGPEGAAPSIISGKLPALSGDGRRVAFVVGAKARPDINSNVALDLFVTDMSAGVSRKAGTVELTRDPSFDDPVAGSPITSLALSTDGRWLAVVTARINFLLPALHLIGEPATQWDFSEVYAVDLERREIERAVRGYDASEVNGAAADDPSISADGNRIAFVSSATNLFPGDSNQNADAFVLTRATGDGTSAAQDDVSALGDSVSGSATVKQTLSVAVTRVKSGGLRVRVRVPGPGLLDVRAFAATPTRREHGSAGRVPAAMLAGARAHARVSGEESMVLRPARRYRRLLRRHRRLAARLIVRFQAASGGRPLEVERKVTFRRR